MSIQLNNTSINISIPQNNLGLVDNEAGLSQIYIGAIIAIVLILIVFKAFKSKRKPRSLIVLVGERFAGKTQLFINLNQGKKLATVPSIHNNQTSFSLNGKPHKMIDYIGDNISKQQILQRLDEIHTIIHVIDGSDPKTISDASMFIYRVLVSKQYQKQNCNYLLFLNKNEVSGYIGKVRFEQKLEDQIELIKQSRIHQGEENQNEDDFIKLSKNRYKVPLKIVEGSAESNVKDLVMTLESL